MRNKSPAQRTLICIPTYNEAENIERLVPEIKQTISDVHILVVDDNSPDGTGELVVRMTRLDDTIHLLQRPVKQGLGPAYLAAFAWALEREYEYIFEFDADFSHNPAYLPGFLSVLEQDTVDVVVGSRRVNGGRIENWGIHRKFLSWGGNTYANLLLGTTIRDLTGGFNGFKREVLESIKLDEVQSSGYCFQIELKYRCLRQGYRVCELPIVFPDRIRGESKMNTSIMKEAIGQVIALKLHL